MISGRKHRRALEHIARLEAENARLDRVIAAAEALPAAVSADGVSDAELEAYERDQAAQARMAAADAVVRHFAVDRHPLSQGRRRPDRNVPVLDEAYFEAKRRETQVPVGFYSASTYRPLPGMGTGGYYGGTCVYGGGMILGE